VRKLLWAVVIAASLSGVPTSLAVASPAHTACKRAKQKKAKLYKAGKYKVGKFKVKKLGKRSKYKIKPSSAASPKPISQPAPDPAPGKASE